jgi:hypothetical protein
MDAKTRGWVLIIGALLAGYFAWAGNATWSLYILALLSLISGYHHAMGKHK